MSLFNQDELPEPFIVKRKWGEPGHWRVEHAYHRARRALVREGRFQRRLLRQLRSKRMPKSADVAKLQALGDLSTRLTLRAVRLMRVQARFDETRR